MSQLTDYAENKIADFFRGQGLTLPANWYFAFGTAADDASFTEISVTGYARVAVARSLANFAGTQADGSTTASVGTSQHKTSNNVLIDFGTPSGSPVTATHVGLFDASTSGHCWVWYKRDNSISVGSSAAVSIAIGAAAFFVGLANGCSDYLANKFIDLFFRAQAFTWPATLYFAAYTAAPNNAGGGTEVAAIDYSRPSLVPSLTSLSGTQSAGSTTASTGTGGVILNNAVLNYPTPSSSWGSVLAEGIKDAATVGNLLFWGAISPKTVGIGAPLTHAISSISITIA